MLAKGFSYTVFITSILSLWRVCLVFLGPHLWHMKVPRLGVKLELWLPAYTTATAMQDLSCICDLHHSSWQHQILSLLSKARDWTGILMDTTQVHYHWATMGILRSFLLFCFLCVFVVFVLYFIYFHSGCTLF